MKRVPRSAIVVLARNDRQAWWWPDVDWAAVDCEVDYWPVVVPRGRPRRLLSRAFGSMVWQCVVRLFRARRQGHRYILTFECDWPTFIIAGLQTLLFMRRPRHVVLQFIMREKTDALASRVKYAFMRWCFSSVHRVVCSSRSECVYYDRVFGWSASRALFVPFHTDPAFLEHPQVETGSFVLSAGRTFRDYPALLDAFEGLDVPLLIVASPASLEGRTPPPNVRVEFDVTHADLASKMAESLLVVVPLTPRQISTGQSVVLEAMAMGKAVIATRVAGTEDYLEHMKTGILVPPGDPEALRDAVTRLVADPGLRMRLGHAARARVLEGHLPRHYAVGVRQALETGSTP